MTCQKKYMDNMKCVGLLNKKGKLWFNCNYVLCWWLLCTYFIIFGIKIEPRHFIDVNFSDKRCETNAEVYLLIFMADKWKVLHEPNLFFFHPINWHYIKAFWENRENKITEPFTLIVISHVLSYCGIKSCPLAFRPPESRAIKCPNSKLINGLRVLTANAYPGWIWHEPILTWCLNRPKMQIEGLLNASLHSKRKSWTLISASFRIASTLKLHHITRY